MTSIYGFAELVIKRKLDEDKRMDMLQTIHRQSATQIKLINDLLDLARIEARRGSDFDYAIQPLAPIVERTTASIHISGDRRKARIEPPAETFWVNVDSDKLGMVITNLLTNALKYSQAKPGSKVTIRYVTRDNAQRERRDVGVQVADQGIGMSSVHLARLFDRFFRADTSSRVQGTGLGMTIAKEIVDIHDGEIVAESELGRGTTMTMWLPLHEAPMMTADESPPAEEAGERR
jgi:signal transduction histidine kinase